MGKILTFVAQEKSKENDPFIRNSYNNTGLGFISDKTPEEKLINAIKDVSKKCIVSFVDEKTENAKIAAFVAIERSKVKTYFVSTINSIMEAILKSTAVKLTGTSNKLNDKLLQEDSFRHSTVLIISTFSSKNKWDKFMIKVKKEYPKMNILIVASYKDYICYQKRINTDFKVNDNLRHEGKKVGYGFISDKAQHLEIITAIETVAKGEQYRYCFDPFKENAPQALKEDVQEIIRTLTGETLPAKVEELSQIIQSYSEKRIEMIRTLNSEEKNHLDNKHIDDFVKLLIINKHKNRKIAETLVDKTGDVEAFIPVVRQNRMKLINQISNYDTIPFLYRKDGQIVELTGIQKVYLELIASGYSNDEIATTLNRSIDTVKTERRLLKEQFSNHDNNVPGIHPDTYESMLPFLIQALRTGLLKLDDPKSRNKSKTGETGQAPEMRKTTIEALNTLESVSKIDQLSELISGCTEQLLALFKELPATAKTLLSNSLIDRFVESLILKEYSNWTIADILNSHIENDDTRINNNIDIVRKKRSQVISRISEGCSMGNKIEVKEIKPEELAVIKLLAMGKSMSEISEKTNIANVKHEKIRTKFIDIPIVDPDTSMIYIPKQKGGIIVLNKMDIEYLKLIAAGCSNEEIALKLDRKPDTVKKNRMKLREKFNDNPENKNDEYEATIKMVFKAAQIGLILLDVEGKNKMNNIEENHVV